MNATTPPTEVTIMETEPIAEPKKKPKRKPKMINPRQLTKQPKIGRNEACPCGSGIKYKYCHLLIQEQQRDRQLAINKQVEESMQTDIDKD
jgi:hypothetical protein